MATALHDRAGAPKLRYSAAARRRGTAGIRHGDAGRDATRHSIRDPCIATRNRHAGQRLARDGRSLSRLRHGYALHPRARRPRRTLEANGYRVREVDSQACCGALHEHAGDRAAARALAQQNATVFEGSDDLIVVNSAGCGALLKEYGHLLGNAPGASFGARVRDVTELLAAAVPRVGGPLETEVVYDAPCHLQHAQRVHDAPLAVLSAIPGLRLRVLPGSDKCCGSAGIYSVLHPDMARAVLDGKIADIAAAVPRPKVVATGNPGCLMQIGAGLAAAGLDIRVAHPVELLDESYRRAGFYGR